jgi:ABC-2 type transport system permease protein
MVTFMRTLAIANKFIREMLRDRTGLFFAFMFPIMFVVIFSVAFKNGPVARTSQPVAVINLDEGAKVTFGGSTESLRLADKLLEILRTLEFTDEPGENMAGGSAGRRMFDVITDLSLEQAVEQVKSGDLAGVLVVPPGFSRATVAHNFQAVRHNLIVGGFDYVVRLFQNVATGDEEFKKEFKAEMERWSKGERSFEDSEVFTERMQAVDIAAADVVHLHGDLSDHRFVVLARIMDIVIQKFLASAEEQANERVFKNLPFKPGKFAAALSLATMDIKQERTSIFDYQVPGLVIYAVMILAIHVTASLAAEEERKTLERMKLTRMTGANLLGGLMITWLFMAVLQILLLFGMALLLGYHAVGSIWLGMLVGLCAAVASIALGLVLTTFITKEKQASGLGTLVVVPLSFLTGAFFPIPNPIIVSNLLGRPFGALDLLPWTHAIRAMRMVVTYDKKLFDVTYNLAWTLGLSAALFVIGVLIFTRRRLRRG